MFSIKRTILTVGVAVAFGVVAMAGPAAAAPHAPHSIPSATLVPPGWVWQTAGWKQVSPNGRNALKLELIATNMQELVVNHNGGNDNGYVWSSGTHYPAQYAAWQSDGNLVIYDGDHQAVWASGTNNGCILDSCSLAIQDDGNVVIYNNYDQPIWATNTDGYV